MNLTTTVRHDERSYRTLLNDIVTIIAMEHTKRGIELRLAAEGKDDIEASKQLAVDTFDMLKALQWLRNLDPALCPDVEPSTFDELDKAAKQDKVENPDFYSQFQSQSKDPK